MTTKRTLIGFAALIIFTLTFVASCAKNADNTNNDRKDDVVLVEEDGKTIKLDVSEGIPTVIDFYATWCEPCKKIEPEYKALKAKYSDKLNFMTVDIDQQPDVSNQFNINVVPTFVFLDENGNEVYRFEGADSQQLNDMIKQLADY